MNREVAGMVAHRTGVLAIMVVVGALSAPLKTAEAGSVTFNVRVTNGTGVMIPPFDIQQVWTFEDYGSGAPIYYDFGSGSGLTKSQVYTPGVVMSPLRAEVVGAAPVPIGDGGSISVEEARYASYDPTYRSRMYTRFRSYQPIYSFEADGSFLYGNYGTEFYYETERGTDVETLTIDTLADSVSQLVGRSWYEGFYVNRYESYNGPLLESYGLSYSGIITSVVVDVPEPGSGGLVGLALLGTLSGCVWAGRRSVR